MKVGGLPTLITVLLALAALLPGGGVPAAIGAAAMVAVLVPRPRLGAGPWLVLHAAVIAASAVLVASTGTKEGLALLVGWLLIHRAWTGSTAQDARVSLLLATLLALLACLRGESLSLGVLLIGYATCLPAALIRATAGDGPGLRIRGIVSGVAVLVSGTVLFFLLPRLHGGYFAASGGVGGTGSRVVLGDESAGGSTEIAARVRVTGADGLVIDRPTYLRGRALDHFDGRTWTATRVNPVIEPPTAPRADDRLADVTLEPQAGGILFAPPGAIGFPGLSSWRDGNDTWHHHQPIGRLAYTARITVPPSTDPPVLPAASEAAWLQLPDLDPRIINLAWTIDTDAHDPRQIAQSLTDYLSNTYLYVETPPAPGADPLASFLFENRRGHCEYFASALAVMLRVRGVPARLATGFYTDERDLDGEHYIARASNAHAWVEVPLASGWTTFDPSPIADASVAGHSTWETWSAAVEDSWAQFVIDYDLGDQFNSLEALGREVADWTGQDEPAVPARTGFGVAMGALIAVYVTAVLGQLLGNLLLVRPERPAPDALSVEVERARRVVAQRGWDLPAGMPVLAAAEWLVARAGATAEPFERLARMVYAARYGGGDPKAARRDAKRLVRELGGLVRRPPSR